MISIAILEDEAVTAVALTRTLRRLGYRVAGTAKRVQPFLDIFEADHIDLAILDIMVLGNRDGISAAAALRASANPAIIFLTSYSDAETVARTRPIKPNGYLVKPFDQGDILAAVETALANHLPDLTTDDQDLAARSKAVNGGLTPFYLNKVEEYVHDNISHAITVSALADLCNLSEPHFATQFRKSKGVTPHQFVTDKKISLAKKLLRNTADPVADVSVKLGYRNASYFSSLFRKQTGLSPSDFRNV